jgi:hypothetical protein
MVAPSFKRKKDEPTSYPTSTPASTKAMKNIRFGAFGCSRQHKFNYSLVLCKIFTTFAV